MARKQTITKIEILEGALSMLEESGIESISARELARKLNCTTTPIYTYFKNMNELIDELYNISRQMNYDYLAKSLDYFPPFKEFGIRHIKFSIEHKNIYDFINFKHKKGMPFGLLNEDYKPILQDIRKVIEQEFQLTKSDAIQVLSQMLIFSCGIINVIDREIGKVDFETIANMMSNQFIGGIAALKTLNGTYNEELIKKMLSTAKMMPRCIKREEMDELG